ncbi:MAG: ABC alpha-glucoside transporter, inner membrane subunit AglF [uncultured Nocardioidaceae bacterium]|uniref:ABC alpha-glucoside transporter, inner membrane subunit AglF n=1 Tax=uncultured Nocardioidaceae bacterium TaxID=253824 RepID=A0A6J4MUL0_9ACTN|nr:MAG: ABC alpha-glucoside transporter, inner membrane subunit AglF [uncultured Nocardioidaceae bacterium]
MTVVQKGSSTGGSSVLEPDPSQGSGGPQSRTSVGKIVIGLVGMIVTAYVMYNVFLSFGIFPQVYLDSKILIGLVAILVGVGGAGVLFFFLNMFVEGLPRAVSEKLYPYAYLLPGFGLIGLMLLYPAVQTIIYSFADQDSESWVGFENYTTIFGDSAFRESIINNLLWLALVPAITVAFGVLVAVLADKLGKRGESLSKSIIFLPMAISFVGASAIWGLVYDYSASGEQTVLLNAIWSTVGGNPVFWLREDTFRLNSLLLMVILVWLQTGFAMILLSSAIKGVPDDTLEAARIDGASEWNIFWRVVIPQIKGTIITVFITVLILVLKVFDIVYVLTNGQNRTEVIANLFFKELFANSNAGYASAIVVVLLLAVTPVLVYQVRHFRAEEANR